MPEHPVAYNIAQAAGQIRVARVGRRVLVPHSAIVEFLERGGVEQVQQVLYGNVAVRKSARAEALA